MTCPLEDPLLLPDERGCGTQLDLAMEGHSAVPVAAFCSGCGRQVHGPFEPRNDLLELVVYGDDLAWEGDDEEDDYWASLLDPDYLPPAGWAWPPPVELNAVGKEALG